LSPETNKSFCILPWVHLTLFPEGSVKLCCKATEYLKQDDVPLSLQSQGLHAVWNSAYMRETRKKMVDGRPVKACADCYHLERAMGESYRTYQNERWKAVLGPKFDSLVEESKHRDLAAPDAPVFYQLMPGNLCNLKCRMCSPTFSSLIERDEVHSRWTGPALGKTGSPVVFHPGVRLPGEDRRPNGPWYRDDAWVREVLLKNSRDLRALYFTGGEPMIEKQVENILDHLIAEGVAGNVFLEMNTNATVLRDGMLEKLQRFQGCNLGLSLDGYGRYHEYIRYPARWSVIEKNVERLAAIGSPRFTIAANPVLQVYNVLNIVEALEFFDRMGLWHHITVAETPWYLSVHSLPARVRGVAAARLRAYAAGRSGKHQAKIQPHVLSMADYLEKLPDKWSQDSLRTLMRFTSDLDADRKQSVRQVHAELLELLAQDGVLWTDERSPREHSNPLHPPAGVPAMLWRVPLFRRWAGRVRRWAS
jgi:sulfatase maturation enzyme AslB (radical SAM superfamily)